MKTAYTIRRIKRLLGEGVLADALSPDIESALSKTPYGNNPMFMGGERNGMKFFAKALKTQFDGAKEALKKLGQIDSVKANTPEDAFSKIVLKCQKIESLHKNELEKFAVNYVIDLFSVPENTVKIDARLVNKIENGDKISPVEPFDGDVEFEVSDIADMDGIDGEISKRYFLNAINMGAGMRMSENVSGYVEKLFEIDGRLPQLYREALLLNNYMIFNSPYLGITDKSRNQIGLVDVSYGSREELVNISAQGIIFPVLLCELIRGFMELFSAHGLPKDRQRAEYIVKKADYLKAEPWQMRFGPYMWNIFTEYFEDTDTSDMPFIYQFLSKLKPEKFFKVFSEMMAKTSAGKEYAKKIVDKALERDEASDFADKMAKRKEDKNIITDNYMSPEEI